MQRPLPTAVRRRGVTILELILVLPLLVIAIMAIVQLGLLYSQSQNLEMASRAGAQVASRETTLPTNPGDPVPVVIIDAIGAELAKIGVFEYRVELEHNIDFGGGTTVPVILESTVGAGPANRLDVPTATMNPNRRFVRVIVSTGSDNLAPNVLSNFGFDLTNHISQQTTARRYAR